MPMPKGSLQRAPWCCGLLVVQHGAGVEIACVKGCICIRGQEGRTEGGAHMLRHLEASIAPYVCVKPGVATATAVAAMTRCAKYVHTARQARRLKTRNCELSATIVQSSLTWTLQM